MPGRITRLVCEVVAIGAALAIFAYMAYRYAGHVGLIVHGQPMFGDFIAFWSAGHLALEGNAGSVYDTRAIYAEHLEAIPGLRVMAPWNSPPTFLLICMGLAMLPYPIAALTWSASSWISYITVARRILPDTRALIFAVTVPAAVYQLGSVQIVVMLAAITGLAFYWLDRRPIAAGALVSLLAIKPHLALLWPVMLALSGRWKAFASAAFFTLLFAGAAGLVFGFDLYVKFIENFQQASTLISQRRVSPHTFGSLFGFFMAHRAPYEVAIAAQAVSAIAAVGVAAYVFWKGTRATQAAALCGATLLLSPYLFFYDTTLLAVGAAMLGWPRNRIEFVGFVAAWGAGLAVAANRIAILPLCPLAAWIVLILAVVRLNAERAETAALPEAQAQPT